MILPVSGTEVAYFHICHRKLWLFAHEIKFESFSELVAEGKLTEKNTYNQRAEKWKEVAVERIKVDYYDPKQGVVREVKKSNKIENAHVAQVKYYLFVLDRNGFFVSSGLIEYPIMRQTKKVIITEKDRKEILLWESRINEIKKMETPPPAYLCRACKRCAYFDFCFVE